MFVFLKISSSPAVTRKRISSKKFTTFTLGSFNNELLYNCGSFLKLHKESAWCPQKIIVSIIGLKTVWLQITSTWSGLNLTDSG